MKDIVIKASRIKAELLMLLYCYIAANLVNVYAIIKYQTQWMELLTWQRFVLFIAVVFYVITVVLRVIFFVFRKGYKQLKTR